MTMLWTSEELRQATRGTLYGPAFGIADIVIDSRQVTPGCLFVALPGERVDGHDYIGAALKAGAAAALVSRVPDGLDDDAALLRVEDVLRGLHDIAVAARARSRAKVLAVTGSVGKTGTKDSLAAALAVFGKVHASAGNLNNHIGAPLSLARLPRDAAYAVFELGMNHGGEISALTRLVRPHLAIITTVTDAHIGHFRDIGEIAAAKAEIFEGLVPAAPEHEEGGQEAGIAVLNRDNAHFRYCAGRAGEAGARIVTFGRDEKADICLLDAACGPHGSDISVSIQGTPLDYHIDGIGAHWAANSTGVLACIAALGLDTQKAARAIRAISAKAGRGRQERIAFGTHGLLLVDESYNASPASVAAALDVLAMTAPEGRGRRIAVLGDMLELGERAADLHMQLAGRLRDSADLVFTVGPMTGRMRASLPPSLNGGGAIDAEAVAAMVAARLTDGDTVLVKGSLGTGMAPVIAAIRALATPSGPAPRGAAHDTLREG